MALTESNVSKWIDGEIEIDVVESAEESPERLKLVAAEDDLLITAGWNRPKNRQSD